MNALSSLVALLLTTTACLAGCAADASSSADDGDDGDDTGIAESELGFGPRIAVTGNGTGCSQFEGTARLSSFGRRLSFELPATYVSTIDPGESLAIKDCALGIELGAPNGLSYAIKAVHAPTKVKLDAAGMSARISAKPYFMGNPAGATEVEREVVGPFDGQVGFDHVVAAGERVWSPCGAERRLNLNTRLFLRNNAARSGHGKVDASTVTFELTWRRCPA